MVGSTVLIESVFVLPGLGNLMISGIRSRDYMVVVKLRAGNCSICGTMQSYSRYTLWDS